MDDGEREKPEPEDAGTRILRSTREVPTIMGTFLGVPIIRIIVFWGLYWGPFIMGNYHKCLILYHADAQRNLQTYIPNLDDAAK